MSGAEERSWEIVRRAFEERAPAPRRRTRSSSALVLAALVAALTTAVLAAVFSPPGRAVFERVREAVGVEHADQALFSLNAPGRLLVVSAEGGGVWLAEADGYKRKLGTYDDAEWSPHGLYVVATRRNELAALDVDKGVRWTLARHDVAWPTWTGSRVEQYGGAAAAACSASAYCSPGLAPLPHRGAPAPAPASPGGALRLLRRAAAAQHEPALARSSRSSSNAP